MGRALKYHEIIFRQLNSMDNLPLIEMITYLRRRVSLGSSMFKRFNFLGTHFIRVSDDIVPR